MNVYNILGYIGASFLTIMMYPQVYQTIKTNKTRDISVNFIYLNLCAVSFLIPYSVHYELYPVLMANTSVGICNGLLLYFICKNKSIKDSGGSSVEIESK